MLTILLAALDQTIVATALPAIVGDLRGFNELSWVVSAYLIATTVTIPLYGKLSDIHGRRRMMMIAIALFLVGSLLCGIAQSMGQLIGFRVIQGIGAGGLIPLAQAAIADLVPPRDRGRYQGFVGAVWAVAAIAGPLLGGTLTDAASWRWIFLINLPLGVLAMVVIARTLPGPAERREHRLDLLGAATLTSATTCLLLVSIWGGTTYGWASVQILGLAGAGVALAAAFVFVESRAPEPLLPLRLFRNRIFSVSSGASFVLGALLFGVTIYVPLFVTGVQGGSATSAGAVLIPLAFAWVLISTISGQLISRFGRYRPFPIVGGIITIVGTTMLATITGSDDRTAVAVALTVIGCGMGLMWQPYIIATQNTVAMREVGVATGGLVFFRSMGGSLAVAALGTILTNRLATELVAELGEPGSRLDPNRLVDGTNPLPAELLDGAQQALASSLHTVFLVLVPLAVGALALALALQEKPLARTHGERGDDGDASSPPAT
ncbi:MAG: MFS transporter [Solirubrobacteraceae bacterium]|nr:MFS transporter [Solirubrobacteraceae bacterium]